MPEIDSGIFFVCFHLINEGDNITCEADQDERRA